MASLDDIYDMIQKLEDSNIDYLLITIQKGKKIGKADVFFNLQDKNSLKILTVGLNKFGKEIDSLNIKEDDEDDEQ
jgi:hypothetical protein